LKKPGDAWLMPAQASVSASATMQDAEPILRYSTLRRLSSSSARQERLTHQGVQSEFHRLARNEPRIDPSFPPFLNRAYNLETVADYETERPDSEIPPERSAEAIETAARLVECIAGLLAGS